MNFLSRIVGGQTPTVLENGVLLVGSDRFRSICFVHNSGATSIAHGYEYDDQLTIERRKLLANKQIPHPSTTHSVSLEDIARAYTKAGTDTDATMKVADVSTSASQKLLKLIEDAARARASDVKIFQHDDKTIIRAKIAGRAQSFGVPWTPEEGLTALTYAFDARDEGGGHTTMQATVLQSFSISNKPNFPLPANVVKLRGQKGYQESDVRLGQHMVFRLFYSDDDPVAGDLDDLGFDAEIYNALAAERESDQGCVIVGGSTGDGKSTTLIRMIDRLAEERDGCIDIVTVEDPVEYRSKSESVMQIPVKSSGDGADRQAEYRGTLMHAMRINPDVCVVSEIRDSYGAKEVLQFVASGHKVYTTIHVASANKILFRLIELGVPPAELAGSGDISMLMKQSLVPLLCKSCSLPNTADAIQRAVRHLGFGLEGGLMSRNPKGCPDCLGKYATEKGKAAWAGYERMAAVGEVIRPDDAYFEFVAKHDEAGARRHWLKPIDQGGLGGTTLSAKLELLVKSGRIDITDAIRVGLHSIQKMAAVG
jgi:general secretion pathway protein E